MKEINVIDTAIYPSLVWIYI